MDIRTIPALSIYAHPSSVYSHAVNLKPINGQ